MSKKQEKLSEQTLTEILLNISDRLSHIEDASMDTREVLITLVKQSNQIVKFLKQIEIEDITDEFDEMPSPLVSPTEKNRSNKMQELKELINDFMDKHKDLKEFEEELKKHKKDITPGMIGES